MLLPLLLAGGILRAAEDAREPAAGEIMRQVRANLPQAPVLMRGQLRSGPLQGGFEHDYSVEIRLDFSRQPMTADYVLRDSFGGLLEQLFVLRHGPADVDARYAQGAQAMSDKLPPPHASIQSTDVTWSDLMLSFLWWPALRMVGRDTFRGRDCVVVELAPPGTAPAAPDDPAAILPETCRLWVDEKMHVFLQMEVWLAGRPARRLMVRSFKKIDGQWMVKDLEMRSVGLSHRTLLRIEDMQVLAAPADESARESAPDAPPAAR